MSYADRNRQIKQVLTQAFGAGKVTVRGHKGTAYGWVTVSIAYAPKDRDKLNTLKEKTWALFKAAKISVGTYGYDDPGSDYGYGNKMHLNFEQCRDVFSSGERVTYCGNTGTVKERDYRTNGDWYVVVLDNDTVENNCYKGDLSRLTA